MKRQYEDDIDSKKKMDTSYIIYNFRPNNTNISSSEFIKKTNKPL